MSQREYDEQCSMYFKAFGIARDVCSQPKERGFVWDTLSLSKKALFKSYLETMLPGIQIEETSGKHSPHFQYFKFSFQSNPTYVPVDPP